MTTNDAAAAKETRLTKKDCLEWIPQVPLILSKSFVAWLRKETLKHKVFCGAVHPALWHLVGVVAHLFVDVALFVLIWFAKLEGKATW